MMSHGRFKFINLFPMFCLTTDTHQCKQKSNKNDKRDTCMLPIFDADCLVNPEVISIRLTYT